MEYPTGRLEEDTAGMGRSYECVFCKRGFTTAQALGGHMNIHRKDRAKNSNIVRPSTNPSTGLVTTTTSHDVSVLHRTKSSYSPAAIQSYPPTYYNNLHGYFPVPEAAQYCHGPQDPYLSRGSVPGDCSWSLSLQVGSSRIDDNDDDDDDRNGYGDRRGGFVGGEQELDLELRLGHGHGRP